MGRARPREQIERARQGEQLGRAHPCGSLEGARACELGGRARQSEQFE